MAVQSSGGGVTTQTGGVVQASGGSDGGVVVTAAGSGSASDTPESLAEIAALKAAEKPAGEEGQQEGGTQEEPKEGDAPKEAPKEGEEPTLYKTMEEVPAERVEEIKTSLKAAGGIYADPRYEAAALEFEALGTVSDATKAAAAEAFGVPPAAVDQFVAGQVAQRQLTAAAAKEASSGAPTATEIALGQEIVKVFPGATAEADYTAFMAWGNEGGLTVGERSAYDSAIARGDAATAGVLLAGFNAKYQAAGNGAGPRDITATGLKPAAQGSVVEGFKSSDEMTQAMADPRYKTDAAYNAQVAARVAASRY